MAGSDPKRTLAAPCNQLALTTRQQVPPAIRGWNGQRITHCRHLQVALSDRLGRTEGGKWDAGLRG